MVGKSGGQLIIWDEACFDVTNSFVYDFCIGIRGKWKHSDKEFNVLNVYGPHDDINKQRLWNFLHNLIVNNSNQAWVIGGDFNEVRNASEGFNCNFIESRAKLFNEFIEDSKLIDIPLGSDFHTERGKSDHCPITLKEDDRNFGPKPIKVFDDWLEIEGVEDCIKDVWAEDVGGGSRLDCRLRNKLKKIKMALKSKSSEKFGNLEGEIELFRSMANTYELRAEFGQLNDDERTDWLNARKEWFQREKIKCNMLKQKAKIRWVLEGDENSKYFHSVIKRGYNKCNIRV
ncbi:uncharacterized protein [Rutidosis leptorrhynchoides]|uniref:uncharacterized protein n=1 Tax=Rutidosis leptorrhynchoides TaxID=125765 RepID=UPI003A994195